MGSDMITMKMLRDLKRASEQPRLSARQQRKARKLNRRIKREVLAKLCGSNSQH